MQIDRIRKIIRTRTTDSRQTDKTLGPVITTLCSKFDGNCLLLHKRMDGRALPITLSPPLHGQYIFHKYFYESSFCNAFITTVEPCLTNTLLRRAPHLNERFWSVPNIFPIKSYVKTPLLTNNPALPAERTAVCPPEVFVREVFLPARVMLPNLSCQNAITLDSVIVSSDRPRYFDDLLTEGETCQAQGTAATSKKSSVIALFPALPHRGSTNSLLHVDLLVHFDVAATPVRPLFQ